MEEEARKKREEEERRNREEEERRRREKEAELAAIVAATQIRKLQEEKKQDDIVQQLEENIQNQATKKFLDDMATESQQQTSPETHPTQGQEINVSDYCDKMIKDLSHLDKQIEKKAMQQEMQAKRDKNNKSKRDRDLNSSI